MKKRIVIAERKRSLREMLRMVLTIHGTYEVVAEATGGLEAVELCRLHNPELVILELMLPELSGAEVIRRLRRTGSATRTLVFTDCACVPMITEGLRAKPHGFVEKSESLATLHEAIAAVVAGRIYFSGLPARLLDGISAERRPEVSPREREIAQMTAEGLQSKEIAARLNISSKTVENHRTNLMQKLNVHGAVDLTRYALANGWVSAE